MTRQSISSQLSDLILAAGPRAVRGAELTVAGMVQSLGDGCYTVASQSRPTERYTVNLSDHSCTCPDTWSKPGWKGCKHHCAALLAQEVEHG